MMPTSIAGTRPTNNATGKAKGANMTTANGNQRTSKKLSAFPMIINDIAVT
jgi:hypothetical protein